MEIEILEKEMRRNPKNLTLIILQINFQRKSPGRNNHNASN